MGSRNSSNGIPLQKDVVCFYFDILGFKELIDLSTHNWKTAMKRVQQIERLLFLTRSVMRGSGGVRRLFSDNSYLSTSLEVRPSVRARRLVDFLYGACILQWNLANGGVFVRGAVSTGTEYASATTLFGTALVRAYEAESKLAKVPRIVLTESFIDSLEEYLPLMTSRDTRRTNLLVQKDADGVEFANYLAAFHPAVSNAPESFNKRQLDYHRLGILSQVALNNDDLDILKKYLWVAKYHNSFATKLDLTIDIGNAFGQKLLNQGSAK